MQVNEHEVRVLGPRAALLERAWIPEACEAVADVVQEQIHALPDGDRSEVTERLDRRIRIRSGLAERPVR